MKSSKKKSSRSWETVFDIISEDTSFDLKDGTKFEKKSYFIVRKGTTEKVFPAKRKWGYSDRASAKRGAAHIYRDQMNTMEKILLG